MLGQRRRRRPNIQPIWYDNVSPLQMSGSEKDNYTLETSKFLSILIIHSPVSEV